MAVVYIRRFVGVVIKSEVSPTKSQQSIDIQTCETSFFRRISVNKLFSPTAKMQLFAPVTLALALIATGAYGATYEVFANGDCTKSLGEMDAAPPNGCAEPSDDIKANGFSSIKLKQGSSTDCKTVDLYTNPFCGWTLGNTISNYDGSTTDCIKLESAHRALGCTGS
ncbi:hypothetical protein F4778DRAFT_748476 [Xylariomycetidae sp. FL2044]|nr:hypothetical protein F4778DRAFT_748476 [Xylariomycetidae sp. FL2044]